MSLWVRRFPRSMGVYHRHQMAFQVPLVASGPVDPRRQAKKLQVGNGIRLYLSFSQLDKNGWGSGISSRPRE